MSRLPRVQEHLKTGFSAEAMSAARYRAFAGRAERDGMPNLAAAWRRLARSKDELAILQLEAAGQVRGEEADVREALAEERYENEVLYPKMISQLGAEAAAPLRQVLAVQAEHAAELDALRQALQAARGDIEPAAVLAR